METDWNSKFSFGYHGWCYSFNCRHYSLLLHIYTTGQHCWCWYLLLWRVILTIFSGLIGRIVFKKWWVRFLIMRRITTINTGRWTPHCGLGFFTIMNPQNPPAIPKQALPAKPCFAKRIAQKFRGIIVFWQNRCSWITTGISSKGYPKVTVQVTWSPWAKPRQCREPAIITHSEIHKEMCKYWQKNKQK